MSNSDFSIFAIGFVVLFIKTSYMAKILDVLKILACLSTDYLLRKKELIRVENG